MQQNYQSIKPNSELKSAARSQLKGNWGNAILLCVIFYFLTLGLNISMRIIPYVGIFVNLAIAGPFALGLVACFMKLVRNEPLLFENLFDGFSRFTTALIAQLLIFLLIILWSMLFIIPGFIAQFRYSMTYYILNDNPDMGAKEALDASSQMMLGHKWRLFCLYLSFIGWAVLSAITFGIGYIWLIPYCRTSVANFYENLKEAASGKEILS